MNFAGFVFFVVKTERAYNHKDTKSTEDDNFQLRNLLATLREAHC